MIGRPDEMELDVSDLWEFAHRYTEAWCSGEPSRVAEHYSIDGSLTINGGPPAVGTAYSYVANGGEVSNRGVKLA